MTASNMARLSFSSSGDSSDHTLPSYHDSVDEDGKQHGGMQSLTEHEQDYDDEEKSLLHGSSKGVGIRSPHHRRPPGRRAARALAGVIGGLVAAALVLMLFSDEGHCTRLRSGVSDWWHAAGSARTSNLTASSADSVIFGAGIGDVTGPIVQTNMMGYANLPQVNTGIHTRNRARAFVVGSSTSSIPANPPPLAPDVPQSAEAVKSDKGGYADPYDGLADRWLFLNTDLCMGDTAVRRGVIAKLREAFPGVYGERNVAFVGTHSHSGIAGYHNNLLPTFTSRGIIMENYDAIVQGAFVAAAKAHNDFEARKSRASSSAEAAAAVQLSFGNVTLREAHVNRSPSAYLLNPASERARYANDQEDEFGLLKFSEAGQARAVLSWYAVHGTSLAENNTLTSTDNKGLAALWLEQAMDPGALPGQASFVAGYSQSQVGDTSPNTLGAFCPDGLPCGFDTSTCATGPFGANVTEQCIGRGPGYGDEVARARSPTGGYDWKSNEIIARYQVDAAQQILAKPDDQMIDVAGHVTSAKMTVDMSKYAFALPNGTRVTTCPAALGFGFAGGTTDGPGAFDFHQGTNDTDPHDPFFSIVGALVHKPSKEQVACQAPKRILLDTGETKRPYLWSPNTVETQIFQAGNLFITVMPGEFTTMAGRRLKEAVARAVIANGIHPSPIVMLSGPANTYGHYIATPEEYVQQRYEGGSTLYGPWTLDAYIDIYTKTLVPALKPEAADPPKGELVAINIADALHFQSPVVYDNPPALKSFGDVVVQPKETYLISSDDPAQNNVTVSFIGANPRNNLRLESTHFEVQRQQTPGDDSSWAVVRTDGHHTTTMRWTLTSEVVGSSRVDIAWAIEKDTQPGTYRIVYYGSRKTPVTGKIKDFQGISKTFTLQ